MKTLLYSLILLALGAYSSLQASNSNNAKRLREYSAVLRDEVRKREYYIDQKQNRIDLYKGRFQQENIALEERYRVNSLLVKEYLPYQLDSTIVYIYQNIDIAEQLNSTPRLNDCYILLVDTYAAAAIYYEAFNVLNDIDIESLSEEQRLRFDCAKYKLYSQMANYSICARQRIEAKHTSDTICSQILTRYDLDTPTRYRYEILRAVNSRDYRSALDLSTQQIKILDHNSHEFAQAAYMRALIYKELEGEDSKSARMWYTRSAIADIVLGIRDHNSLSQIAHMLLADNNFALAMEYTRLIMTDSKFYNSRLRPWQDIQILPKIEHSYSQYQRSFDIVRNILFVIAILFLIISILFILTIRRQHRKLRLAHSNLEDANIRLYLSNQRLQSTNMSLASTNQLVAEANRVKEEYIGLFFMLCSENIKKIEQLRVHAKKRIRNGEIEKLRQELSNSEGKEFKDFYNMFDTIFLRLYPSFVEEFNSLLQDEYKIVVKSSEFLTTELRIFALIRLGINDSSKIAMLLNYSISTVYNYRSKIRNQARSECVDFESAIITIGTFDVEAE